MKAIEGVYSAVPGDSNFWEPFESVDKILQYDYSNESY